MIDDNPTPERTFSPTELADAEVGFQRLALALAWAIFHATYTPDQQVDMVSKVALDPELLSNAMTTIGIVFDAVGVEAVARTASQPPAAQLPLDHPSIGFYL